MPAAEFAARILLFEYLLTREDAAHFQVYSDCKLVVSGYNKGRTTKHGALGILWDEIWQAYDSLSSNGWQVSIHNVKAHTTSTDVEQGIIQKEHRHGNEIADHWAGHAAKKSCHP